VGVVRISSTGHKPLAIVFDKGEQVGALRGCEVDLTNSEEKDRVEIIQIPRERRHAGRDTNVRGKGNRLTGDEL